MTKKASSTENALLATLQDIQIRNTVEETVKSMLQDVELAASLQKELTVEAEHSHLQKRALASEAALQETKLIQEEEKERTTSLADELVRELWSLSQELGSLKRWKKQNEGTIEERDVLMAKLLQAEDQIEDLKARPVVAPAAAAPAPVSQAPAPSADTSANEPPQEPTLKEASSIEPTLKDAPSTSDPTLKEAPSAIEEPAEAETQASPETPAAIAAVAVAEEESSTEESETPTSDPPPVNLVEEQQPLATEASSEVAEPAAAAVSLVLDDGEAPLLETFEEAVLLQIFAYLDALEIVNLAQVNIALYSRVDFLFGISEDDTSVPTEISTPAPPIASPQATIVELPPAAAVAQPQMKAPQPIQKKAAPVAAAPAATATGGIISLFQTSRPQQSSAATAVTKKQTPTSATTTTTATASKQPLSAAMANSMAEKLTDKEINAIISMTEKLNHRNREVDQLTQQNLNLHGQLDGTQAVKEFLVTKVRTMERTLSKSTEVERKTTQQIASDQEVIAFLDSRVRELEHQERLWVAEKKSLSDQLIHVQVQTEQKITVLSDMLQYERERGAENDRDWKTTRKVLIKEVKSCRSQIWTLQAETMGLQEQNDRLKRAVLASGAAMHNGGGSPMRDDR